MIHDDMHITPYEQTCLLCSDNETQVTVGDNVEIFLKNGGVLSGGIIEINIDSGVNIINDQTNHKRFIAFGDIAEIRSLKQMNKNEGDTENKKNIQSFSYRIGEVLGAVLVGCIAMIAVALTVKFIFWLF